MADMSSQIQTLTLRPIGTMRTSLATKIEAARQPAAADEATGTIELLEDQNLEHAVENLVEWERIWVIFWFDRNPGWRPKVLPPRSTTGRKGVLATRSPHRPNPLGLSVLRLDRVEGLHLHVRDVDLLDGTPILDIKPYVPYTDACVDSGSGWLKPGAEDPAASWVITFTSVAEAQLAWITQRSTLPLRERITNTLKLGPQPHPYRRIKRDKDGGMRLAVQDWRIAFRVEGQRIEVQGIRTGYRESQLVSQTDHRDANLSAHRAFVATFG
jgi:tRNA-Thr(GGU) m(6)t(6)A37 methyltransferase TsaA